MPVVAGRYEIQKSLGEGGIGEAFLVRDRLRENSLGVLKMVPQTAFPKKIESLRREFVTLTGLAHPNIARVQDFGEDEKSYFFLEEYVEGQDLFKALAGANYNQILAVAAQILRALEYLHRSDLIHGDLKPENILVVQDASPLHEDAVKLIDFGLAAHLSQLAEGNRPSGSLPFMAPEVLLEQPLDHRADLYALGVCLYRLLTGRLPFDAEGVRPAERMRAQIEQVPSEPRWVKGGIPRGLNDLTMRLLEKDPARRFASAADSLEFLNRIEKENFPLWTENEIHLSLYEGPFIGREREIEQILKFWKKGEKKIGITGPAGSGRRRLLQELKSRLQLAGEKVCLAETTLSSEGRGCTVLLAAPSELREITVPLPPWSVEECAAFLTDRLRLKEIPPAWRNLLIPLTEGLPQRTILLAEFLLAEKFVEKRGDHSIFGKAKPPADLTEQAILEKRLARIDEGKRELLGLCAFARIPLSTPLLSKLTGRPPKEVERGLASLEGEGWVRRLLHGGSYHFRVEDHRLKELLDGEGWDLLGADRCLTLAEERFREGDFLRASHFLDRILARGVERLGRDQKVRLFQWGSLIFAEGGDLDRAADCCRQLSVLQPRTDAERGEMLTRWGWLDYLLGNYEEGLERFEEALICWKKKNEPRHEAAVSNYIGMTCQRLHQLDRSIASYREASALLREGDPMRPVIQMNLAVALQEAQNFDEAIATYEKTLPLAAAGKDRAFQGQLLNNLANLYIYLGKLDRASEYLHLSLKIAIANGFASLEGSCHLFFAVIADKEGDLSRFRDSVSRAVALFEAEGAAAERRMALLQQAYYEFTAGEDNRARQLVARLRGEISPTSPLQVQLDLLEGKIAARQNPPDTGLGAPLLERARRRLEATGDRATLWDVSLTQARLWRFEKPESARSYYEKALGGIDLLAQKVPAATRASFFRDRKQEKIREEYWALNRLPKEGNMEKTGFMHLIEINRVLASQHNLDQLLESMMDAALDLLQAERGFILLLEGTHFNVKIARNLDKKSLDGGKGGGYSRTIANKATSSGKSILVVNAREDERFRQAASVIEQDIRSAAVVPLKLGPQVIGTIYVDSRFEPGLFDDDHLKLLEAFADQAAVALRNARQMQEIWELNKLLKEKLEVREHEVLDLREKYEQQSEDLQLKYSYDQIIGRSKKMRQLLKLVDKITDSEVTVLISGESGTGKELIARALHYNGPQKKAPFVSENCAAFSENLLESELFGHVRGSFTGAVEDKRGLFEVAHGGTVFLDEIAEMSLGMQAKLLRVLQEKKIRPIGSNDYREIDVRVICATNQNLSQLVTQGLFREDLYYRINVVRLTCPPLRDRKEDIPLLVDHCLEKFNQEAGRRVRIDRRAMQVLIQYDWPGNVRELANEIEKCCAFGADLITYEHISDRIHEEVGKVHRVVPLGQQVTTAEKAMIGEALKKFNFSRVKTAKALGISRITLYKKMKSYGITGKKIGYKTSPRGSENLIGDPTNQNDLGHRS